ncbi:MAG: hypothetical protein NVS9B4_16620 [Candidatus Acidiferrum sp.]
MKKSFYARIIAAAFLFFCAVWAADSAVSGADKLHSAPLRIAAETAATGAKLTFRRVFKSSTPEFIEISVTENSDKAVCDIRELDEPPVMSPCEITAGLLARIFELAGQLNHFQDKDLDVHRKLAYLGEKTFRWEQGSEVHEAKFNYTLNNAAVQLLQIFEGLARQQEHVLLITRRMKYDRLGIYDALLQFEMDLNRKLLPAPQGALPVLDQIARDSRFVEVARQRARTLAERIRHMS